MSKIEVDAIEPQSGTTLTIGASGDTITIPSGAKMSGQNYPAFEAYLSSDQTVTSGTITKITMDTETFDTAGAYDNSTNYRFTPQTAGKYYVYATVRGSTSVSSLELEWTQTRLYKNGSEFRKQTIQFTANPGRQAAVSIFAIIDMNGSTDYLELYGQVNTTNGGNGEFYGTSSASTINILRRLQDRIIRWQV
jgi:hypothetical protein